MSWTGPSAFGQRDHAHIAPARRVLSSPSMDGVLFTTMALAAGGVAVVAPWHVAAVFGAVAAMALAMRSIRWPWLLVAGVATLVGFARSHDAIETHERLRATAMTTLPRPARCSARARVVASPQSVHGALRWDAELSNLECEGFAASAGRATLYGGPSHLARGDVVDLVAQLAPPERFWNDRDPRPGEARRAVVRSGGVVDARIAVPGRGFSAWVDRRRARVRARIEATFPRDASPLARALVLGETDLSPEDDAAFRSSGLSHLLAVSGMHLVLVVAGAVSAVRGALVRTAWLAETFDVGRAAAVAGIPLAWGYASFAGASGSTVRAAGMMTAALLARAAGRPSSGPRALALGLGGAAVVDPLVAFDVSFLLSAAASAGILGLSRPLTEAIAGWLPRKTPKLAESAAVTLAATLPCAPILAGFSPTLPVGSLVANLVAVPLGEAAALPLCLLHAVFSPWPSLEAGLALSGGGALLAVRSIARFFGSASFLSLPVPPPTPSQLAVLAVAATAVAWAPRLVRSGLGAATLALLLLLELAARRNGAPHGVLRATFLDVGQGDAAIVDLPNGGALLLDGGGIVGSPVDTGMRVVAPLLRARRRDHLDAVVLSHPHPDHATGLVSGTAAVGVAAFWDTGQGEREGIGGVYAALVAQMRRRGARFERPMDVCGTHTLSGARIDVLAPCPGPVPDRGANDNSFVVRISYGRRSFLFMGDAEREEETDLLRLDPTLLRADVLKVGHHGSRTSSTPQLLEAVSASDAVVSTGVRNRFGHPHAATLTTLEQAKVRIWRTDRGGAVTVETDGDTLTVQNAAGTSLQAGEKPGIWSP